MLKAGARQQILYFFMAAKADLFLTANQRRRKLGLMAFGAFPFFVRRMARKRRRNRRRNIGGKRNEVGQRAAILIVSHHRRPVGISSRHRHAIEKERQPLLFVLRAASH
jgi:hypothetical protein